MLSSYTRKIVENIMSSFLLPFLAVLILFLVDFVVVVVEIAFVSVVTAEVSLLVVVSANIIFNLINSYYHSPMVSAVSEDEGISVDIPPVVVLSLVYSADHFQFIEQLFLSNL